jgi:hypothetical protein
MKALIITLSILLPLLVAAQSNDEKLDFLDEDEGWEVKRWVDAEKWEVFKYAKEWADGYFNSEEYLITPDPRDQSVSIVGQDSRVAFKPKSSSTTWFNYEYKITIHSEEEHYIYTVDIFEMFLESTTNQIFEFPFDKFFKGNGKWKDGYSDSYDIMIGKMNSMEQSLFKSMTKQIESTNVPPPEE